ncbi:LysR family transcriptional regulator [Rhodococcus sp. IEGM 1366]|uniref:LysR family transcriptional regulator n=1 Tax=Rhodococcus sp. IEGM 1366 TaxID=3082223 RepID=UPI002954380B|nr:LysR family transcriptional regulator [Rhodococcus sp. IEGM 1366]MDV8071010.1 LysR family transcriptional regulator [Rhodococcus sp. IEGM 1366]
MAELHQLQWGVAIADHGTFTQAATALQLSQPALSHAVARPERELGAKLFERSAARTRLTEAGKAFLAPARRTLTEADSGRAAVDAVVGVLSGELRVVGVRTAIVETARLITEFHRHNPGVLGSIDEPTGDQSVIDAVRAARCDVGIVHTPVAPHDPTRAAAVHRNWSRSSRRTWHRRPTP